MNVQEINRSIITGTFTNEQLNSIMDAVKNARSQLSRGILFELRRGAKVKFVSNRNGQTYTGTVEDIKLKNVIVTTGLGKFRVPANMLEVV